MFVRAFRRRRRRSSPDVHLPKPTFPEFSLDDVHRRAAHLRLCFVVVQEEEKVREFVFPARRDQIQTERRRRLRRNEHRTNTPSLEPARRRRPRPPPRFRDRPSEDLPPFYVICVMCVRVRVSTSPRREVYARAICLSGEGFSSRARVSFFFDRLQQSFLFVLSARVLCVCVLVCTRVKRKKKVFRV